MNKLMISEKQTEAYWARWSVALNSKVLRMAKPPRSDSR